VDGLVEFAYAAGNIFAVLLPVFCYLGAMVLFLVGVWGLRRQSQPDNPFRGKPWVPWLSLILCGFLASFDRILTMANATGGSTVTVSVGALTSYVPPANPGGGVVGATPTETLVNVVTIFAPFFQAFGALACLFALLAWRSTAVGTSRRPQSASAVQFVFGILLINCITVSQWVAGLFA